MICPSQSSYAWALHEFQHADFSDERLTQRAMKVAAAFLDHPQESIPAACGSWADTKGVYRFFNHQKITNQSILHSHYQETHARCNSESTILVAQDTTTMNLSNKQNVMLIFLSVQLGIGMCLIRKILLYIYLCLKR